MLRLAYLYHDSLLLQSDTFHYMGWRRRATGKLRMDQRERHYKGLTLQRFYIKEHIPV